RPFFYSPDDDRITCLEGVCLRRERLEQDPGSDAVAVLGDWVYFADKGANLSRLHVETFEVEYLGCVSPRGRLASLVAADGALWGVAGDDSDVAIVRVDADGRVERFGP